jgi:hypothetical protein
MGSKTKNIYNIPQIFYKLGVIFDGSGATDVQAATVERESDRP